MGRLAGVVLLLAGIVGYLTFRLKRVKHPSCPECGYWIHNVSSDRCPECGAMLSEVGVLKPGAVDSRYSIHRLLCVLLIVGGLVLLFRAFAMPSLAQLFASDQTTVFRLLADGPSSGAYRSLVVCVRQTSIAAATPIQEMHDVWVEMYIDERWEEQCSVLRVLDGKQAAEATSSPWKEDADVDLGTGAIIEWMNQEGIDAFSDDRVVREAEDIAHQVRAVLHRPWVPMIEMPSFRTRSSETIFEKPRLLIAWRALLESLWLALFTALGAIVLIVNRRIAKRQKTGQVQFRPQL